MGAGNKTNVIAMSGHVKKHRLSLAVDTGANVNILPDVAYNALKRLSRGGSWSLHPNDLNLAGVTGGSLHILEKVFLPIRIFRTAKLYRASLYVAIRFNLPTDSLLAMATLRSLGVLNRLC